ncbi:ATPase AAA [Betaproteobacteria bacterium]|nr:ATPase AAA [Betaproteobacteria bacterium]
MPSVLANIQNEICKYAEAIGGITGTDVEIVDEFLMRVAGSGVYRDMLNEDITENGYIYRHTMQANKTILIENPGENSVCGHCSKRFSCREVLDLSTPIIFGQRVIGAIGIICSTQAQREVLLGQIEKFITFIEQIADLIAGKVFVHLEHQREQEVADALRKLIEVIDRGVIAVDKQGLIRHANLSAARMFELERGVVGQRIAIEPTGDIVYDCEEAYLSLRDGMRLHALCKRIALSQYEGSDVTVIVFQDARDFLAQSGEMPFEAPNPVKLIGHSVKMQALRNNIDKIANSAASVLITGESGSGKEVVAFSIHQNSPRRDAPFVTINCAAIPEQLLESELFGYIKGAFSGADPKGRIGKFELAQGGSIFLDEIGDMPVYLQAKLLRVLQERTITRIGSNQVINIDVRVIAASNKDIADMASRHLFREDLLYRLNVVPIVLPPLRERREDIADLAQYFADEFAALYGRSRQKIAEDLANTLYFYDWPGNVRELRNVIEYMFVMQGDARALNASHLPPALQKTNRPAAVLPVNKLQPAPGKSLRDESGLISDALARHGRDLEGKRRAAEELGMGIATLYRKIKKYGIGVL